MSEPDRGRFVRREPAPPPILLHRRARSADRTGVAPCTHRAALALSTWLVAASAAADPEHVLLEARELGRGWEVVREAPVDPRRDPDLRGWGVREQHVRHYTRGYHGKTEVCSVEVWAFDSVAQASAAEAGFSYPDWQISREGPLLLMLRGLIRMRGRTPQRGVFPDCDEIGSRIRARASAQ